MLFYQGYSYFKQRRTQNLKSITDLHACPYISFHLFSPSTGTFSAWWYTCYKRLLMGIWPSFTLRYKQSVSLHPSALFTTNKEGWKSCPRGSHSSSPEFQQEMQQVNKSMYGWSLHVYSARVTALTDGLTGFKFPERLHHYPASPKGERGNVFGSVN